MFNLVALALYRNCKFCGTPPSRILFSFVVALILRSEGQANALPDNISYWDAVYTEAAIVKNFGSAWQGLNWSSLKSVLGFDIRPEDKTLVLGAGDSGLAQDIFDAGCRNVTAVDFSSVLVSAMGERSHGVIWQVEDASKLSFPDSNFDIVLDLGLLDTVGIGGEDQMLKVVAEAHRVLSPGATYISSSTEPPLFRLPLFSHSFGGNATKVLFVPRPRELDHRVRRVDAALDLGKVSVYISRKPDGSIDNLDGAEPSSANESTVKATGAESLPADGGNSIEKKSEESATRESRQDADERARAPDSQNIIAGDGHIEQANSTAAAQESARVLESST